MATPSRPPPSNALWGQLLRKSTLAAPATVPLPPTAPLDKTGTSMRILLHDTQANFENFSTRVDTVSAEIERTRREIVVVKDLFQGAQESLTNDVVDLVNRSQTQIQKSLGSPAQATTLDLFRKDVDARLHGLSKRIDDMQSVILLSLKTIWLPVDISRLSSIRPSRRPYKTSLKRYKASKISKERSFLPSYPFFLYCKPFHLMSTRREVASTKRCSGCLSNPPETTEPRPIYGLNHHRSSASVVSPLVRPPHPYLPENDQD
ncbi:hypothetical protein B0H16DRAFT_1496720 [Mycena metata]|uniref:Uncharacterized protein n=1 Tax=Mycena metata TaxID=1033252 RepID=A0AAD7K997_9AGAR|nr:hypothetical protein B0H16DRAFT_1496720 [Mycena metata]